MVTVSTGLQINLEPQIPATSGRVVRHERLPSPAYQLVGRSNSEQNSYIRPSRSDVNGPRGFVQPGASQFPRWSWFCGTLSLTDRL